MTCEIKKKANTRLSLKRDDFLREATELLFADSDWYQHWQNPQVREAFLEWAQKRQRGYLALYALVALFAILSLIAGVAGIVSADIPAWWRGVSLPLVLYGVVILLCLLLAFKSTGHIVGASTMVVDGMRRDKEQEILAQAEKKLLAEKKANKKDIAKMQDEMNEREREANENIKQLEKDKERVGKDKEKLTYTLHGVQETLGYYSANERLDVYDGDDALRECGGIYVIKNAGDGRVKIGVTDDNFKRRFGEIQSHCASAGIKKDDVLPVILVPLDEGKYEVEREIHHALAENKTAGEWFDVTPEEAVAAVLQHVRDKRVANYKERSKIPVGKNAER